MQYLVVILGLLASPSARALDVECRFSAGTTVEVGHGKTQIHELTMEQISQFIVYGIDAPTPTIRREKGFRDKWGDRKLQLLSKDGFAHHFAEILPMGNVQLFTWYPATGVAFYSVVITTDKVSGRLAAGTCSRLPAPGPRSAGSNPKSPDPVRVRTL